MENQVAVLDVDQRFERCALIGPKPELGQDERPSVKLDESLPARLRLRQPRKPLRLGVRRAFHAELENQPVMEPDR